MYDKHHTPMTHEVYKYNTSIERSRCLVFDGYGICEIHRMSKPKRKENAFCMYVSHPRVITLGLSARWKERCKYTNIPE